MHMSLPFRHVETLFMFLVPHFFQILPARLAKKTTFLTDQKPKDIKDRPKTKNPWTKKITFLKKTPIFLKQVSNDCIWCADSKNIHNMVPGPMHKACTKLHGMYVFEISIGIAFNCITFEKGQRTLKKKNIFFIPGVLVFGLSVRSFLGRGRGKF